LCCEELAEEALEAFDRRELCLTFLSRPKIWAPSRRHLIIIHI
jgi:hypothetical protein